MAGCLVINAVGAQHIAVLGLSVYDELGSEGRLLVCQKYCLTVLEPLTQQGVLVVSGYRGGNNFVNLLDRL